METSERGAPAPDVYDSSSIVVLEGLEAVRKRPGMYAGDPSWPGTLSNLVLGIVESSVRAHLAHDCTRVAVTLQAGGGAVIEDDGPGIRVEVVDGRSTLERLACWLHACCSSDRRVEGLGVELSVTNALSSDFEIEARCDGRGHRFGCRRGLPRGPIEALGAADTTGTRVWFVPDPLIFPSTTFDAADILSRLREIAFLNPGLRIDFADRRAGGRCLSFRTRGLAEWVTLLGEGQQGFPDTPWVCRGVSDGIVVEAAFRWVWTQSSRVESFVNQSRTTYGGTHVIGLYAGIGRAIRRRAAMLDVVRGPVRLPAAVLRRGLVAVLHIEHPNREYRQTRDQLFDRQAFVAVRDVIAEQTAPMLWHRSSLRWFLDEPALR